MILILIRTQYIYYSQHTPFFLSRLNYLAEVKNSDYRDLGNLIDQISEFCSTMKRSFHHHFEGTARRHTTISERRESRVPSRMTASTYVLKGFLIGGREVGFSSVFPKFFMRSVEVLMSFGHPWATESGAREILGVLDPD